MCWVPTMQFLSEFNRQVGRQAEKQAGRKAGRQAGRNAGRQEEKQAGRQEEKQAGRKKSRQAGRQAGRQKSRHTVNLLSSSPGKHLASSSLVFIMSCLASLSINSSVDCACSYK